MDTIAVTLRVQPLANEQLRLCVFPADPGHNSASGFSVEYVCHLARNTGTPARPPLPTEHIVRENNNWVDTSTGPPLRSCLGDGLARQLGGKRGRLEPVRRRAPAVVEPICAAGPKGDLLAPASFSHPDTSMKIDAHHHFWKYSAEEYGWIDEAKALIRRDFLPPHLREEIDAVGIDGVVSVQARQSLEETAELLRYSDQYEFMRGVVGWAPLVNPSVKGDLERFSQHPKLKGVRHVLQDEPDDHYISRDDFNLGVAELRRFNLAYDILIFERHLPQTIEFVDRHPNQVFVLDHMAKPRIKDNLITPWRENISELARRPNVSSKISGMVTEADFENWTEAQLQPYLETVLQAFGPSRLMFGSDWPVCLLACGYERWFEIVSRFIGRLSSAEQERILGGTAAEVYRLYSK